MQLAPKALVFGFNIWACGGSGLGLSPKGLRSIAINFVFYEKFQGFQWIWGFRLSLKIVLNHVRRIFHEWKGKLMKSRGIIRRLSLIHI